MVLPSIHRTPPFISRTSCLIREMSIEVRLSLHCEAGLVSLLMVSESKETVTQINLDRLSIDGLKRF